MLLDSGVATIWRRGEASEPGTMPMEEYTAELFKSYYGDKTVGFARYWTAQAHDRKASLLIEIQRCGAIDTADRCELESVTDTGASGMYSIIQVQHVTNEDGLPMTDLTLERIDGNDEP